uniref:Tumor necrosis factor receptor superfamily, member 1a n=1 Tax=Neogobius melanostomus TaxID=47308 RepID=A0A8C6UGI9_9GOBI
MVPALFLRIVPLLSLSIPAVLLLPKAEGLTCQGDQFLTKDQICCNKCHPGYKVVENCRGHGLATNCTLCPARQYMDTMNFFPNCFSCKRCRADLFEIQELPCTHQRNTVCRCMDGYYKSVIDSVTFECSMCSTCGDNEIEDKKCTQEGNTECKCSVNYYRVKNKCLPSTILPLLTNVIAGAVVAVVLTLVLVIVITHFVTKRQTERKLLSSQESVESPQIYEALKINFEDASGHTLNSTPLHNVISQEPSNLPDCIPLEIKIPDVIYTLLDLVPVLQVKQLVRSLGVSDTVIERAELDHRSSKEAHYQMLRAWAEQGSHTCQGAGGQGGVLHLPQLYQLLDKLRLMHLEQTAQELETQYHCL